MNPAERVSETRLWQRLMDMAAIGGFGAGGVNRQAFSDEDNRARALLQSWADGLDLDTYVDPIGNLFFRYSPDGASGDPVVTGSHADSQPSGGRFDGIYGVLAGFEAIEAIKESGAEVARPLEIVAWSNEEGSRFAPGAMGSMVYTGLRRLDEFLDVADAAGITLREALPQSIAVTDGAFRRDIGHPFSAYVEAHVEQGPVLESADVAIGAVTDIQGCRWFEVEVKGESRHAGSTPLSARRDALQGAHRIIAGLNDHFADPSDTTRFTVGRFEVQPNSPNTVAERAVFTIDFRHPDAGVLASKGDAVADIVSAAAGPCSASVSEVFNNAPVQFPDAIVAAVNEAAEEEGISCMEIPSGAFHDAMFLAAHCPTGMIFVPSRGGISHHPDEYTEPAQLADGARVLARVLVKLSLLPNTCGSAC